MDSDFYKELLDHLYDGVYFVDQDRRVTYWNAGAERITGYRSAEVVGSRCSDNMLMHVDERGERLCTDRCPLLKTLRDGCVREMELYLSHKDGHRVPVLTHISPIPDADGEIAGVVEVFSDNSANVAMGERVQELQRMALFDELTGLGNRRYAEMSLRARFDQMGRYGWPFGVLFADIDHFKAINDKYGHDTGDRVLKMVSQTLWRNIRSFDVVARWGGEELIVIVANVTLDELYALASKLRALVEESRLWADEELVGVTVSIGATAAQADDTPEALMKRADELMYQSKQAGRNCISCELLV